MGEKIVGMYNKTAEAQEKAIDGAKRLQEAMRSVNVRGSGAGGSIASIGKEMESSIASIERYNAALKNMNDFESISKLSIKELKDGVAALRKQYEELRPNQAFFAEEQQQIAAKTNVATQQLARLEAEMKAVNSTVKSSTRVMKEAKKAVDDAEGSYNKLSKETAALKKELKALPNAFNSLTGEINQANKQAVVWQRTIERNEAALRKMDASMGNYHRNVGNYTSATQGMASAFRDAAVQIIGVTTTFEAIAKSVKIIDQMTRLKLSLEAVSEGSRQVTLRWDMLAALADKTGQDVVRLTETYVGFAAAARNTALEGRRADEIFTSFTGAFSALGKSSEVAERGLYAVQQMLSKGKVSSEELNQQLAEALPGANKIFADALRVTTAELADMLKKGEVLSVDVLPKVAKALEQMYGDRAQQNAKTMSGSWTRLTNQFVIFLDLFNEKAGVSSFFADINNHLANTFRGVNRILEKRGIWDAFWASSADAGRNKADQDLLDSMAGKDVATRIGEIGVQQDLLRKSAQKLKEFPKASFSQLGDWGRSDDYKKAKADFERRKQLVEDMIKLNRELRRSERAENTKAGNAPSAPAGDGDDGSKKRILTQFEKLIAEANKVRGQIVDELLADTKAGRPLEPSDEAIEKWKVLYARIREVSDAVGDQIPSNLRELNAKLTKQPEDIADQIPIVSMAEGGDSPAAKNTSGDFVDLTKYNALLRIHEEENQLLRDKVGEYGALRYVSKSYLDQLIPQQQKIQELEKQAAVEQIEAKRQAIAEEIQLEKDRFNKIMEMARAEAQGKRELQQASFELISESTNAIFQIISDQREADRESLQMQMEHELSLVQGNEAAQERIKKDYAKKDLELRQKQARLEKAQAAFSIGISTARAVVNALATGGPPWIGIALAAIVGAMGAIQLAAVLAKPLPQFYKGTDNAPEGPAWVAERGPEIHESKGRMTLIPNKTIMPLSKGDKIYTAAETRAILSNMDRREAVNKMIERGVMSRNKREEIARLQGSMMVVSQQKIDYDKLASSFGKELDKRPVNQTLVDEQGIRRRHIRQNSTITYNNSRFSLK